MHRPSPLASFLLAFLMVSSLPIASALWAAPPKQADPSTAAPSQVQAPSGLSEAAEASPELAPGIQKRALEKPSKTSPQLDPDALKRPTEPVRRPQGLTPAELPEGARDNMAQPQVELPTPVRELAGPDVRIVEIARLGRKIIITGRADRAVSPSDCCDLVLTEGPSGTTILWRGRAAVTPIGDGFGFVAMADHTIPGGRRQQLIAELLESDRNPGNNRLMKWVGTDGGSEFTEDDRIPAATGGFGQARGARQEIRSVRVLRTGADWAEVEVAVWSAQRASWSLQVVAEGIPAATCANGRGESRFLVSEYNDLEEFNESFRLICRSPSQDASGRILATLLEGTDRRLSERSVPWTVRASEGTVDRRAARGDAQVREIAGTDAAPADLAVSVDFSTLDGRPHFAPVSVRNLGGSRSPALQLRVQVRAERRFNSGADVFRTVPALDPGESWSERVVIGSLSGFRWEEISGGATSSVVVATVDSEGVLYESNEANNQATKETDSIGRRWRLHYER